MYNLVILLVLVMLLFFLSHDKKFGKLFTKNSSLQIIVAIILAYFSLNRINFGILLVVSIIMVLRYSYINNNVLAPLKDKYKTPLIKDIHRIIEKFSNDDDDDEDDSTKIDSTIEQMVDLKTQNDELKMIFADLDKKMNSMLNK